MRLSEIALRPDRTRRLTALLNHQLLSDCSLCYLLPDLRLRPGQQEHRQYPRKTGHYYNAAGRRRYPEWRKRRVTNNRRPRRQPATEDATPETALEEEEGTPSEPEATIDQEIANLPDLGDTSGDLTAQQPEEPAEKDGFPHDDESTGCLLSRLLPKQTAQHLCPLA